MNHPRLSLFLLLAAWCPLALASSPVAPAAQPVPSPTPAAHSNSHPHPHSMAMAGMGKDQMFAMLDADKNGSISRAEFDAHHTAMHKAYGGAMHHGPAGCMPMEPAAVPEAVDAPKADAGK